MKQGVAGVINNHTHPHTASHIYYMNMYMHIHNLYVEITWMQTCTGANRIDCRLLSCGVDATLIGSMFLERERLKTDGRQV